MPKQSTGSTVVPEKTTPEEALKPIDDFIAYMKEYAKENPEMTAICCVGIGFVLGWKLKPW